MTRKTDQGRTMMERARRVVPGGVYGHGALVPADHPKFFRSGDGCRVVDLDGNEYIDFMCGYGPNLLGINHPRVEAAAERQRALGDVFSGPTECWVELAEMLVERIAHAQWAMFMKNGTDATTLCLTIARAATGRRKVVVAGGAYHGAAPWCTPSSAGVTDEDRVHLPTYTYNDLGSLQEAVAGCDGDLAGVVVSPFKHDTFVDQELVDPEFARGVRAICDEHGAALIMDEVRAGFRLARGGSWEEHGVDADLGAWGKAMANGRALSGVVGSDWLRDSAASIYATGSFWYAGVPMAAAIETLKVLDEDDVVRKLEASGLLLREGLAAQAKAHGFSLRQTGPPQMPLVLFDDDPEFEKGVLLATEAVERGVYLHPFHNMFLCAAHTPEEVARALERTDDAFGAVRRALGA